jgi:hypothetical protein
LMLVDVLQAKNSKEWILITGRECFKSKYRKHFTLSQIKVTRLELLESAKLHLIIKRPSLQHIFKSSDQ